MTFPPLFENVCKGVIKKLEAETLGLRVTVDYEMYSGVYEGGYVAKFTLSMRVYKKFHCLKKNVDYAPIRDGYKRFLMGGSTADEALLLITNGLVSQFNEVVIKPFIEQIFGTE